MNLHLRRKYGNEIKASSGRLFALILLIAAISGPTLLASDALQDSKPESGIGTWTFGLEVTQTSLKSGQGQHLLGLQNSANLGWGYLAHKWYTYINFDIISGPYGSLRKETILAEYEGTGLSTGIALSAGKEGLRTNEGNYGFLLALRYRDVVGRNVSETNVMLEDGRIGRNWSLRVNNFSLLPAIFFCWLKPDRPAGNRPQDLMTRLEGYFLTIGISTPLSARYYLSYQNESNTIKQTGLLKGYSIVIALSSLFNS